jgi:UDP-N-acetylglucosamine diphosphorylase/glucosamine-1-phosphate N-acetyltransferase
LPKETKAKMSNPYILFDDKHRNKLLPFTLSRCCADIRWGILTIKEKWEQHLGQAPNIKTVDYLQDLYGDATGTIFINSRLLPSKGLVDFISKSEPHVRYVKNDIVLFENGLNPTTQKEYEGDVLMLQNPWEIFQFNHREIQSDFDLITSKRSSAILSDSNRVLGNHSVFLEEGAKAECSIFNTTEGPIYIGKNAEVQEGCMIRGPFALCDSSQLKMGARIYTGTTIGPHSKVGGEINNSVIFGFSNKAHEGFLGNSVIGEWCNLGADTNNSNLKNNYAPVKIWSYEEQKFINTGLQFCGLMMGDHSKCGINTMFNTGTVVGFSANIFGSGFPRNYIPSFSWGGASGLDVYQLNQALKTAELVFARRNKVMSIAEKNVFEHLFNTEINSLKQA